MTTTPLITGHVGLNVTNLERSTDFYRQVFDLDEVNASAEDGRKYALLGREGQLVLTLWQQSDSAFDAATPGLHHLSFQAPDMDAVRAAETRLRELGARFFHDGVVAHSESANSGGIFFADPDGIRLEIFAPTGGQGAPVPTADAPTCGFF